MNKYYIALIIFISLVFLYFVIIAPILKIWPYDTFKNENFSNSNDCNIKITNTLLNMIENDYINGKIKGNFIKSRASYEVSSEQCVVDDTNSNSCEWRPDSKYMGKLTGVFELIKRVCHSTLNSKDN